MLFGKDTKSLEKAKKYNREFQLQTCGLVVEQGYNVAGGFR